MGRDLIFILGGTLFEADQNRPINIIRAYFLRFCTGSITINDVGPGCDRQSIRASSASSILVLTASGALLRHGCSRDMWRRPLI